MVGATSPATFTCKPRQRQRLARSALDLGYPSAVNQLQQRRPHGQQPRQDRDAHRLPRCRQDHAAQPHPVQRRRHPRGRHRQRHRRGQRRRQPHQGWRPFCHRQPYPAHQRLHLLHPCRRPGQPALRPGRLRRLRLHHHRGLRHLRARAHRLHHLGLLRRGEGRRRPQARAGQHRGRGGLRPHVRRVPRRPRPSGRRHRRGRHRGAAHLPDRVLLHARAQQDRHRDARTARRAQGHRAQPSEGRRHRRGHPGQSRPQGGPGHRPL